MTSPINSIALVLLAAGRSKRFGGMKQRALIDGEPLLRKTARIYTPLPFLVRIAVVRPDCPDLSDLGFEQIMLNGDEPMSASLAAGVDRALHHTPRAILLALGDMPFVSPEHVTRLIASGDAPVAASWNGSACSPPALFDPRVFPRLRTLEEGDSGARPLLRDAHRVAAPASELRDIDTRADLDRGRNRAD